MLLTPAGEVLDPDAWRALLATTGSTLDPVVFGASQGRSTGPDADPGSPLVEVSPTVATQPAYDGSVLPQGEVPLLLRADVRDRLVVAEQHLPAGLRLVVLDGWRSVRFQQVLVDYYGQHSVDDGFVSAADSDEVAPHVTGGAVDLTIGYQDRALGLGTDFDEFLPRTHVAALESRDPSSVEAVLRRVLFHAMLGAGFAPYQLEWWHFSYGDSHWARYYGRSGALFGEASHLAST